MRYNITAGCKLKTRVGIITSAAALAMVLTATACVNNLVNNPASNSENVMPDSVAVSQNDAQVPSSGKDAVPQQQSVGQIYLYGEYHGQELILQKEAELWYEYYHDEGLRHLFVELPYYTAEFMNRWMESESDEILDALYEDWKGSSLQDPYIKAFYQRIKRQCPETVFHGTDVGHQYDTTGERFLDYLRQNQLENSEQYRLAQEAIEQGRYYYDHSDTVYRENKMAENFAREFEALKGESVMGIYGGNHIGIDAMDIDTGTVPSMANQLYASYGEAIHTSDLTWIKEDLKPQRMDSVLVAGKEYQAAYFGKQDLLGFRDFAFREFWRLENAYEDFMDRPKTGDTLSYNNYPMLIGQGQVFVMDIVKTDGSVLRKYFRSDGKVTEGYLSTEEFTVE